jgi:hypothetical protein
MLAELVLKGVGTGDALALVNANRTSHGLADLGSIDLAGLIIEREKELFCTGNRLPDQRRFDLWHLGAGTWQYLPLTMSERNETLSKMEAIQREKREEREKLQKDSSESALKPPGVQA